MTFAYEDILYLPHHVSEKRARMSAVDRAAQFSPFAALTGFEAAVEETARLTCSRVELDVDGKAELNAALAEVRRRLSENPRITVTHFVPDHRKNGGIYAVSEGRVRRIHVQEGWLALETGEGIRFEDMLSLCIREEEHR